MSFPAESFTAAPPEIPGYEILDLLGRGGMGVVYLAYQPALKRQVCVKVLSNLGEAEDPEISRERFRREAELLASVAHPHILSLFDHGVTADSGLPFLVTEYIEGGDLRRQMTRGEPFPPARARALLTQVGEALEYLHGKGILHRDLKPENVFLATDELCKVGDFGLAVRRESAGELTRSARGLGTAGYVAPEQQYGLAVTERSDQYSLAALAYELLTGRRPLGRFAPPSRVNPWLSVDVDRVLLRGLAEEPQDRYPSIRALLGDLGPALERPGRGPVRVTLAAVALLGIALLVGAAAMARRGPWAPAAVAKPDAADTPQRAVPEPSPEFHALVQHRSYRIWVEQGKPDKEQGDAVREANWLEAERQIEREVNLRAYGFWVQQGKPEGAAGEAVSEANRHRAEIELLRETEAALRAAEGHADPTP